MSNAGRMEAALGSPAALEALYRAAIAAGDAEAFAAEIVRRHAVAPDDPLMAAWYLRLQPEPASATTVGPPADPAHQAAPDVRPERRRQWRIALLLSLAVSVVHYVVSGTADRPLSLGFAWGPIASAALMLYLLLGRARPVATTGGSFAGTAWARSLAGMLGLFAITATASLRIVAGIRPDGFDQLALIHLPALAWLTLGWVILGHRPGAGDLFAAVHKSIETVITAGLMAGAGLVFAIMTFALFSAISIDLPDFVKRYLFFGCPGLIPVLAVATVYDPDRSPSEQHGGPGFGRVIFTTGRLLLPLVLLLLAVYIVVIPFQFMEPFRDRGVLIVYNTLLFAVIGLIVTVTPLRPGSLSLAPRHEDLLRRGIIAVAALTLLVSLYAMAAVVYRTAQGGLTMNRLTVIGWNTVNIATLSLLLYRQARDPRALWVAGCHRAFRFGLAAYAIWTLFVLVGLPLLWRDRM